jgi:hypothetical protein
MQLAKRASPRSRCEFADACHREPLGALRQQHLHGPVLRIAPQAETEEVAVLRASDGRLVVVDLQAQAPSDEPLQAGHHPQPGPLARHIDIGVVGIADEPVATPGKLCVELVQHDVRQQRRERRTLRHTLVGRDHDTVRQHDLGRQQPADQHEQPAV